MSLVHAIPGGRRTAAFAALALGALLATLALSASSAQAASCPGFRVLHNDQIGPASLPAGTYTVTTSATSGLSCKAASALFTRFLEDWDGNLPGGWSVVARGSGKADFKRGGAVGFSVARQGGGNEGGGNREIGQLCPGTFTINNTTVIPPLRFNRGSYLLYIPSGSGITCRRASVLFTRFLGQPGGRLPFPWRLSNQTATFSKPEHPLRSAFRVEAAGGSL